MADRQCDCCEPTADRTTDRPTTERTTERPASTGRWLAERPVTDATLPPDVANHMGRLVGAESVETLGDFVAAAREATGGGPLAVDDLCHVEGESPHRAAMDGETYDFLCFFDGVALSHIAGETVEIRTEGPNGDPVTVTVRPDGDVEVTPPDAAMSFGVALDAAAPPDDGTSAVRPSDDGPSTVEANMCPFVRAFHSRNAYERWAAQIGAATVGLPLADGVPIAVALAE